MQDGARTDKASVFFRRHTDGKRIAWYVSGKDDIGERERLSSVYNALRMFPSMNDSVPDSAWNWLMCADVYFDSLLSYKEKGSKKFIACKP